MNLIEGLYELKERKITESGSEVVTVQINPDHSIFTGHFPDTPILPGVCLLHIVRDCVGERVGTPIMWRRIRSTKFLQTIIPTISQRLEVNFTIKKPDKVSAEVTFNGKVAAKIMANYSVL